MRFAQDERQSFVPEPVPSVRDAEPIPPALRHAAAMVSRYVIRSAGSPCLANPQALSGANHGTLVQMISRTASDSVPRKLSITTVSPLSKVITVPVDVTVARD